MSKVFSDYINLVLEKKSQLESSILLRQYMLKEEEDEGEKESLLQEIKELEQEAQEHEEVLYLLYTKNGDTQESPIE